MKGKGVKGGRGETHRNVFFRVGGGGEILSGAAHSCGAGVLNEAQLLSKTPPSITHCSVTARSPRLDAAPPHHGASELECEENMTGK